ncbi:MAG: DUF1501 domain-containing protein [Bacteroidia bacterium]
MAYSRRDFLRLSGLASASLLLPNFLKAAGNSIRLSDTNGKIFIVIQLSGGNDGLNTLVPFGDDLYYSNRPGLGLKGKELLKIDSHFAFNSKLKGLHELLQGGDMALLNSVGYPNPNRSHFRSLDIWQSGSSAEEVWQTGWLGRYLDACCAGGLTKPHQAIEVDDALGLALKGNLMRGLAMRDPKRLVMDDLPQQIAQAYSKHDDDHHQVEYLHKTLAETNQSAGYIHAHVGKVKAKSVYPAQPFGQQLKLIAELILSGSETAVYYVSLPGFDTHVLQHGQQGRLLKLYSDAMAAFAKDLKNVGRWNDTLVMTFSEFGRRVKQNASKGTDHGTANILMLTGGNLRRKGILNDAPDLKNLDQGDLIHKVDFRQIYATVLQNWLGTDPEIVLGKKFGLMDFV